MQPPGDLAARRWRVLASAVVSFFAVGMTFFAVPPLVPTLRGSFALSNVEIGLLMGAIAVPAIVLSIPLGAALDRWRPRRAGLGGLALMLLGAAVFAAAPTYPWLVAGRLLFGIGGLTMNLLLARIVALAFAGRETALAMGLFTGTYPASMIVLFTLHPWLAARFGWRVETALLAALVMVALPLHAAAMPPRAGHAEPPSGSGEPRVVSGPLLALALAWMLYFGAFSAIATFAPEWAGAGGRGLVLTSVITWVALLGTPLAGAVIDRSGRPQAWCTAGLAVMALTLAAMAACLTTTVASMVALGIVAAAVPPAIYTLPARLVPVRRVGFAFGLITAHSNLGAVAGPALAGAIRDATPGWAPLWAAFACAALLAAALAAFVRPPREPSTIEERGG